MECLTWSLCAADGQGEIFPLTDGGGHLSRGAHVSRGSEHGLK